MLKLQGMLTALLMCALFCGATELQAQDPDGPPWGTYTVMGYGDPPEALQNAEAAVEQRLTDLENEIPPGFSIGAVEYTESVYAYPVHKITFRVWLTLDLDPRP